MPPEAEVKNDHVTASRTAPRPPPAVRLHADWSDEGVRLWLALDATALGQRDAIAAVVRRWMANLGVRVLAFACNGTRVGESGEEATEAAHGTPYPFNEENPWPSAQ